MKHKFEDAVPAEAPAEAPAQDNKTKLVEALTAMGLSAEQAEAVYTMALDLISESTEAPAEANAETVNTEMSKLTRENRRLRRRMRRMREMQQQSNAQPGARQLSANPYVNVEPNIGIDTSGMVGTQKAVFEMMKKYSK